MQGQYERCRIRKYKQNGKDFWSCNKKVGHTGKHQDTKVGYYAWEQEGEGNGNE